MHGIGTFRTDSMQAVITGMCCLLLIPRLAPGLGALLHCNRSQVCLNLYLKVEPDRDYCQWHMGTHIACSRQFQLFILVVDHDTSSRLCTVLVYARHCQCRTDSTQTVIAGMCFLFNLLLIPRLAPGQWQHWQGLALFRAVNCL
jgi:hypothetical protein